MPQAAILHRRSDKRECDLSAPDPPIVCACIFSWFFWCITALQPESPPSFAVATYLALFSSFLEVSRSFETNYWFRNLIGTKCTCDHQLDRYLQHYYAWIVVMWAVWLSQGALPADSNILCHRRNFINKFCFSENGIIGHKPHPIFNLRCVCFVRQFLYNSKDDWALLPRFSWLTRAYMELMASRGVIFIIGTLDYWSQAASRGAEEWDPICHISFHCVHILVLLYFVMLFALLIPSCNQLTRCMRCVYFIWASPVSLSSNSCMHKVLATVTPSFSNSLDKFGWFTRGTPMCSSVWSFLRDSIHFMT